MDESGRILPGMWLPCDETAFFSTEQFHKWNHEVIIPYRRRWEQEKLVWQLKEERFAVKQQRERFDREQEEPAAVRKEPEILRHNHTEPVKKMEPEKKNPLQKKNLWKKGKEIWDAPVYCTGFDILYA